MVAALAIQALFLGHGIRNNTILDIWALEGYYRISTLRRDLKTGEDRGKIQYTEVGMKNWLEKFLTPAVRFDSEEKATSGNAKENPSLQEFFRRSDKISGAIFCLDEFAEREFQDSLPCPSSWRGKDTSDEAFASAQNLLETPLFLGDHDGTQCTKDFLEEYLPNGIEVVPTRVGTNSLLGSSCVAIVHYILDKYHACPQSVWSHLEVGG
eukprot:TRINITY_DN9111_c0_g5_i1.p1 TRINITY_DN9111_c0_g5~~TRINITY_DN9111_c0_g5_i1.p1  ORF type:complete len:246 (-),score=45.25 TRINITY_DN9111_c0_g5_i1:150-779(-)